MKRIIMVVVLLWQWWTERKYAREEGKHRDIDALYHIIVKKSRKYCQDFLKEKKLEQRGQTRCHAPKGKMN